MTFSPVFIWKRMAQARDSATGRFTKGGGGTQVGSAYGRIIIDASGVQASVARANAVIGTLTKTMGSAAAVMGTALVAATAALGAGLIGVAASGVKMAASLEAQMASIRATMQISAEATETLRQKILDLGIDPALKVSTLEAAQAIEMLGRNGLTTTQILDGAARGTILLANATDAQFSTAADIATDAMALFNIKAGEMETAVNGITSVVNNSKFGIEDYAMAMAQGGGVAAISGVEFNDFNAAIAAISPLFRSGSDAGTSFKTMLQRMAAPTGEALAQMKRLGLVTAEGKNAFFDAEGNMRSMAEVAGLLETATRGLSDQQVNQALTTIFGADAIRAAAGMARLGEEEFRKLQETMGETSAVDAAAIRMNTLAGSLEILQGIIETIRIRIGDVFKDDIRAAVDAFAATLSNNADRIVAFFQAIRAIFMGFVSFVRAFFGGLSSTFGTRFNQLNANANGWGRNIVISLARGMAQAMVAVVRVLSQIGQVISHWLRPGSPPLIVPDLDKYGTGAMNAYLEGFLGADFSIFNEIGNTITDYLRSLGDNIPETDLIPRIIGARSAIAEAIALMRETGVVSRESLDNIFASAGIADEALQNYVRTVLELEQANAAVAAAQEHVNQVKEAYATILNPLRGELKALRNQELDRRDEQELADIQRRLAEERLTDAEREALMMRAREIQLQQQIRAIEEQEEAAVDAAEEQLEAAEEAQDQLEAQAEAQQALIEAQIENNNLIREQIDLLQQLADAGAGGAGGGPEDLLGEGGLGDLDVGEDLGDIGEQLGEAIDPEAITDPFEQAIEQMVADIEKEFDPLVTAGEELGETWGGVFGAVGERLGQIDGLFASTSGSIRGSLNRLSEWFNRNRGPITQFIDQTWGRFAEKLLETGQSIGQFVIKQVEKITQWFNDNRPLINDFASLVGKLVAAFLYFSFQARVATLDFWRVLEPILDLVIDEVLRLATLIMQVATGDWAGAWETIKDRPSEVWEDIKAIFVAFFDWVANWFGSSWEEVKTTWANNWEMFKTIVSTAWENIKTGLAAKLIEIRDAIQQKIDEIRTAVATKFDEAKTAVVAKWEEIKAGVLEKLRALFADMGLDFDEMAVRWSAIWEQVKLLASTKWEEIKADVTTKVMSVRDQIITTINEIETFWDAKWGAVRDKLTQIWNAIVTAVSEKILGVKTNIETETTAIETSWNTKWGAIRDKLSEIWEEIKTAVTTKIEEVKTVIGDKIEEIRSAIEGKVAAFFNVGAALINGMKDGVLSAIGNLISAVTGAVEDAIGAGEDAAETGSPSRRSERQIGVPIMQGMVRALRNVRPIEEAMRDLVTSMMTPDLSSLLGAARIAQSSVVNDQSEKTTYDYRQSSLNVVFNGRDRVGQATNMNTLRAMGGGT